MRLLDWNSLLVEHFFNPSKSGKEIHLYISRQEIINLARPSFENESDQQIWIDFINKLRLGLPGSQAYPDIFDKANHAYGEWKRGVRSIGGSSIKYPPYVAHLIFTVLPLIEVHGDYNANNYYDKLDDFLEENSIDQNLRNKLREIDELWVDLSTWANVRCQGELGFFKLLEFKSSTRKYVYKPFYQCVLPPRAVRKLPNFFFEAGLIPKTFYSDEDFVKHLSGPYGLSILELNRGLIEMIKKANDEIGRSVIEAVRNEFNNWTGEENEIRLINGIEKSIRKNTVVPIKLQFRINSDEELELSFRLKYLTEPPPDLRFGDISDIYETENWSRTIRLPFSEHFELKDLKNRWIAKFENNNIRLFIRGGYFFLSNDFWVETEDLSRVDEMYLLCKSNLKASIKKWGESSCEHFSEKKDFGNIPSDFSLFFFKKPKFGYDQFSQLKLYSNKSIRLRDGTGLKVAAGHFLNELMPEIEVVNATGNEIVYIKYVETDVIIILCKHETLATIWLLPKDILPDVRFSIQIENEKLDGFQRTFVISRPSREFLSNSLLPKRNKYNAEALEGEDFIQGNSISISTLSRNSIDEVVFSSISHTDTKQEILSYKEGSLANWLVTVQNSSVQTYNDIFEKILYSLFPQGVGDIQRRRKFSLHLLDFLGFIEYDYANGKIYALPSKLAYMPTKCGRKMVLLGGRTDELINDMIEYCKANGNIKLSIIKQNEHNQKLLAPDTITLESNHTQEFFNIAQKFRIEIDEWFILKMKSILPTLAQYEEYITARSPNDSYERFGLETKTFKRATLKFEFSENIDKAYNLVEFRPGYVAEYGLWKDQVYFTVDKNWGKYLILNHFSGKEIGYAASIVYSRPRQIFFNDSAIAVPASLPFPKLISRLMVQMSGQAPDFKQLNLSGTSMWYNVYRNVPSMLSRNFFRFVFNMNIETTQTQI